METKELLDKLVAEVEGMNGYDCSTGGCGDPECCGSYGVMDQNGVEGDYLMRDDVLALLTRAKEGKI